MRLKSLCATRASAGVLILLLLASSTLLSDQIQMQNGDRYVGHLVALTNDVLIFQSEVLGTVRLPRTRVAGISLGPANGTNSSSLATAPHSPQLLKAPKAKTATDFSAALREMQSDTNSIRQVQKQFLTDATPEANKKFNEMAQGIMTGQMNLSDLRAQAASAAEQLRSLKSQGGEEIGSSLDGYLSILESFLKETPGPASSATNRTAHVLKPRTASPDDE